jgi:hypothetical protein
MTDLQLATGLREILARDGRVIFDDAIIEIYRAQAGADRIRRAIANGELDTRTIEPSRYELPYDKD